MTSRIILVLCLLAQSALLHAQGSNMVVFTQENQPFMVVMNGIQQNPDYETNVIITGLTAPNYKIRILFQNQQVTEINKTVYLQPETASTYEILKNNKGVWVLRLLNSIPIDEAPEPVHNQHVFLFSTTPRVNTSVSSQTTTVNAGLNGGVSITTTTSQTTTAVSGNAGMEEDYDLGSNYRHDYPDYPEYDGPKGCRRPMSRNSFEQAMASISSKDFESSKLTIAKQIISSNCLLCRQVKEIMRQFTFESSKLDFAKYAYKYTWDINNYFLLNDAFEFESSIDDLNRYINSHN